MTASGSGVAHQNRCTYRRAYCYPTYDSRRENSCHYACYCDAGGNAG